MSKGPSVVNTLIRARTTVSVAVLAALSFLAITLWTTGPAEAASSGGVGTAQDGDGSQTSNRELAKYDRLWDRVSVRDRRWARKTAECESGRDPNAIGGGGIYRGAFQFMRSTWANAPKSPGGDPINYRYRTQAVVAIALKNRDGAQHWPVCG